MSLDFIPIAALGLIAGSFITALTYRLPRGQTIAHGRSACPACGHTLQATDLVPLLSWISRRGRCRYCGVAVSWRYPAIEFATVVFFVVSGLIVQDLSHVALILAMTSVMMAMAVYDLEQRRIPNGFILTLSGLALIWRWRTDQALLTAAIECVTIFAIAVLLNAGFRAARHEHGLGMGDAKLMAVCALALSPGPLLLFLVAAGVLGVGFGALWRWRTGEAQFPFAPVLLFCLWASLLGAEPALYWLAAKFS